MTNPNTAFSRKGEEMAMKALESLEWECYDISNINTTWKADIDMIAIKNGEARLVEVKYDDRMASTGNMFIELKSDIGNNKDGWIFYTASNYVMYGDANRYTFYVFRTEDMKSFLSKHKDKYSCAECKGDRNKVSMGALVNPFVYETYYHLQRISIDKPQQTFDF